jgi:uncharacterized membrane protein YfcA
VSPEILALIYAIGLGAGWLVGAVGVGGVLLVPALVLLGGLDVEAATPIASLSFLFTGAAGTVTYALNRRLQRPIVLWLSVGAVPGAVAGAATNIALSSRLITVAVALVLVAGALRAFRRRPATQNGGSVTLNASAYVTIGAGVGFGSALTGTGGPVLLIPVLMLAGGAAVAAVAASQPIQIPIAIAATAGFLALGEIDWPLGIGLGLAQGIGAIAGARFSHQAPARTLRRLVSLALVIAAAIFVGKAVAG